VPQRILIVTPWFPNYPGDGMGNFIYHSADALVRAGNTMFTLVARPWTPRILGMLHSDWLRPVLQSFEFDPALHIRVKHFPSIPHNYFHGLAGPLFRSGTDSVIRTIVKEHAIQLIHVHTELPAYGAVRMREKLGVPVIVSLHGINTAPRLLNTQRKRSILSHTLTNADRVVLVGEPLRKYFAEIAKRDEHFRVVHNGFYLPKNCRPTEPTKMHDDLRIISVSNLHEGKGIDLNIEALAQLHQEGFRNWSYTIVGDGQEHMSLERSVRQHGLEDQIRFAGGQSHNEVFRLLKEHDVFLLPSYREAFGVAYLEAMAAGLLTIGVKGQGPEAFIEHGKTGFLVAPKDVKAICGVLRSVNVNREEVAAIALAGSSLAWNEFTWERHAEKLTALYDEVIRETVRSAA